MPRNISFSLTTQQFLDGSKTQTRRLGWLHVKVGDVLNAIEKGQGLKKGEKVKRLGQIRVTAVRREPVFLITPEDVVKEGFPKMSPHEFICFFVKANNCQRMTEVTVIEFERIGVE